MLFQKICESKSDWDDKLPKELDIIWKKWVNACKETLVIEVPRYHFMEVNGSPAKIELHGFCDASQDAYAAVVYAKYSSENSSKVDLVMSKTRVSPLKKLSIPRLELMSCLILSRLMDSVKKSLESIVELNGRFNPEI